MYPYIPNSCDKITGYLLNLIINLNTSIKLINGIIDELMMSNKFNKNADFLKFTFQFKQGFFHSIKCEGYLEYLVLTKYYTSQVIFYLVNETELVLKNLNKATEYLDNIKGTNYAADNKDFKKLADEIVNASNILNILPKVTKLYNFQC